jgi:hypothetical protein
MRRTPHLSHVCAFLYRATTACLQAKIEDVVRFRVASEVVTMIIKNFGYSNLFPRENYEFYARITGRTLRLDDNWQFTFQYPASKFVYPFKSSVIAVLTHAHVRHLSRSW